MLLVQTALCRLYAALLAQICEREGILVVSTPPNVRDMDAWEGAAVSSTSRLLLPVDEIALAREGEEAHFKHFSEQPLMRRLEKLVLQEFETKSEPLL